MRTNKEKRLNWYPINIVKNKDSIVTWLWRMLRSCSIHRDGWISLGIWHNKILLIKVKVLNFVEEVSFCVCLLYYNEIRNQSLHFSSFVIWMWRLIWGRKTKENDSYCKTSCFYVVWRLESNRIYCQKVNYNIIM